MGFLYTEVVYCYFYLASEYFLNVFIYIQYVVVSNERAMSNMSGNWIKQITKARAHWLVLQAPPERAGPARDSQGNPSKNTLT